jgi:hypothetical protein
MLEDILRKLLNAPPSQRRIQADISRMTDEIQTWRDALIPWEQDKEMELLSLNRDAKWVKKSSGRFLKGVFYSIYQEPMLAYTYKRYLKGGNFDLYFATTRAHQFIYYKHKTRTDVFINGEHVGFITPDWLMYSTRKRLLGRRTRFSDDLFSLIIWDAEAAHLRDPKRVDRVNPRAFEITMSLNNVQQQLLMAMSFLIMIQRSHGIEND